MTARVLFFGATADRVGTRTLDVPLVEAMHSDSFLAEMIARFPSLASHKLYVSINQQFATGDEMVRDGDEVAIFTAVSGG